MMQVGPVVLISFPKEGLGLPFHLFFCYTRWQDIYICEAYFNPTEICQKRSLFGFLDKRLQRNDYYSKFILHCF